MNITDIIQQIDSGALDAHFSKIRETMKEREKLLEKRKLRSLSVGDTVWVTDQTRPTYLIGLEAEVIDINRARLVIKLKNGGTGRFRGERINVYPHHVTPIKPTYAVG